MDNPTATSTPTPVESTPPATVVHTAAIAAQLHQRSSTSKVKRSATWLTAELDQYLRETANQHFAWGTNDCCLFAANAVQAMTGVDIADDFRGNYTDQASAFALIKTVTGGTTVADAIAYCATKHGLLEWTKADGAPLPLMAKRGDLVAVTNNVGEIIAGIVDLSGRYVAAVSDKGFSRIPLTKIQRAWHVSF